MCFTDTRSGAYARKQTLQMLAFRVLHPLTNMDSQMKKKFRKTLSDDKWFKGLCLANMPSDG